MQTQIDPLARVSEKAVLDQGVQVGPFCVIGDKVEIGANTTIGPHCMIQGPTTIGKECSLTGYASIGGPPQDLSYKGEPTRLEIGDSNTIREFVTINRGTTKDQGLTKIGGHNFLMAYCHVAHDCILEDHIVMGNLATLAGHVQVNHHVIIGGLSAIHQFTRIGEYAIIGGGSMVSLDIIPFVKANGNRARLFGINTIGLERNSFGRQKIKEIRQAYRVLFKEGLRMQEALERIEKEFTGSAEIMALAAFIRSSGRGVAR